jgi:WD40 repeat protein
MYLWEVATATCHWISHTAPTIMRRIEWSLDGTQLVSCNDEGSVCLWDASDGHLRVSLQGHSGMVKSVAWSPDGTRLASGGGGQGSGEIVVWDAHSGERLSILSERGGMTYALAWDSSGGVLISGGGDGVLRWWDVQSGERILLREAHQGKVQQLRCSPDGAQLASCGDDGAIRLWDLHRGEHLHTLRRDRPYERLAITGVKGLSEAQKASLHALGAFGETNIGG